MYQKRPRIPAPILVAFGMFIGLFLMAVLVSPKLEKISPAPDSQSVPSTAHIRLTFNQPMDTRSVESRLAIEPRPEGNLSWDGTTLTFKPHSAWPKGSTVTVRLAAGARSIRFIPMLQGQSWSFDVGAPRVLYLWPTSGPADLYAVSLDGQGTTRLTETPHGVLDYTLSSDGSQFVYASAREDGSSDLYIFDLASGEQRMVYSCPERIVCRRPALQPAGKLLAFERREFTVGAAGKPILGPSQIWALDLEQETEAFLVGVHDHITSNPDWSPAGWLSYYDSTLKAIALVDGALQSEPLPFNYIPNDLELKVSWSPDGISLLLTEIVFTEVELLQEGESGGIPPFYSHLYRVEAVSGHTVDLTGKEAGKVEDASPSYAPNGEWIAFTRKYLDEERWTHGRQLWLMRPDGSEARQLLIEPLFGFSSLVWSPDSRFLVYMRKNQVNIAEPGEIWLYDFEAREPRKLIEGGYMPQWIP